MNMMDVAPVHRGGAAGPPATAVADGDGGVELDGPVPHGPPVPQDAGPFLEGEPMPGGVTTQRVEPVAGHRHPRVQIGGGSRVFAVGPLLVGHRDVEVGAVTAVPEGGVEIEEALAH